MIVVDSRYFSRHPAQPHKSQQSQILGEDPTYGLSEQRRRANVGRMLDGGFPLAAAQNRGLRGLDGHGFSSLCLTHY